MGTPEIVLEGIVFGESPRWHDGRLWFADWGANQVIVLDDDHRPEVVAQVPGRFRCASTFSPMDAW